MTQLTTSLIKPSVIGSVNETNEIIAETPESLTSLHNWVRLGVLEIKLGFNYFRQ